jgi:UDP-2,4-diacetamido-2,4,6-trideoxy-beta-L-altropyranose hydrolase
MIRTKVFFRADGSSCIGLGHVVRSLALAQILQDHFDCVFLIRHPDSKLKSLIEKICIQILILDDQVTYEEEAKQLYLTLEPRQKNIIVLDGYHFGTEYQQQLKSFGCYVICIDDIHGCHFMADAVVNHAISAERQCYSVEPFTKCYFGFDYALLRPQFLDYAAQRNPDLFKWNNNVLICLGGADPNNDLIKVLNTIEQLKSVQYNYHIVVGIAYKFYEELDKFEWLKKKNICLYRGLSEADMLRLMKVCSTAICSPSSVAIEYIAVGGLLHLLCIADNQVEFYKKAIELKIAFPFEHFPLERTQSEVNRMYRMHCKLIDGKQKKRFIKIFKEIEDDIKCTTHRFKGE